MSNKTSGTNTLLIELGTTELPPRALKKLSNAFHTEVLKGLLETKLVSPSATDQAKAFAAPRRLAICVPNVEITQPDQSELRRGPAVKAAFDDRGQASPAAMGFAKSCGVDVEQLDRFSTDKGEWLSYTVEQAGKNITELLPDIIDQALKRLPIPKRMRWGAGEAEFVRPVQWLVVLHGSEIVETNVLGIAASNHSRGHRYHSEGVVTIKHADDYQQALLEKGKVVASFNERQALIKQQLHNLADSVSGVLADDQDLLDEVTGLVEHPSAVLGDFDSAFLRVPEECLVSSMRDHQKYFHLSDSNGQLLPHFITISNIDSKDPERVRQGNERVLRARLADAEFFWQTDQKITLESRLEKLENVLFHVQLGSVLQKTKRLEALASQIGEAIGADISICQRGALLAKADLVSDMVGEFDELQGLMGHYYADLDGEAALVGECIEQHYWPRFAGDKLPNSVEAQAVALADKLDSMVGLFAAGEIPTGDKDPYALRRSALSILRILIECKHDLDLRQLVSQTADVYADLQGLVVNADIQTQIIDFIRGRLVAFYQAQDIATNTINAVMVCEPNSPLDFENRVKAVNQFKQLDEAANLASANKRISNILKKHRDAVDTQIDVKLLDQAAEQALHKALGKIEQECTKLFDQSDYNLGLQKLASLKDPVDDFFEQVMVMTDNLNLQRNRLALLKRMQTLFLRVADISLLASTQQD